MGSLKGFAIKLYNQVAQRMNGMVGTHSYSYLHIIVLLFRFFMDVQLLKSGLDVPSICI